MEILQRKASLAIAVFGEEHPELVPRIEVEQESKKSVDKPLGVATRIWISRIQETYPSSEKWIRTVTVQNRYPWMREHDDTSGITSVEYAIERLCNRLGYDVKQLSDELEVRIAVGKVIYGSDDEFLCSSRASARPVRKPQPPHNRKGISTNEDF